MARIPLQIASRGLETGPMVNYSGVSSSPVAGALEGAGDMLQRVGYRYQQQVEEAETFEATQNFNQFKIAASGDLTDIATQTPSSGLGYHDRSMQAFQKRETEFLASVPERLKPKFQALLETERAQFSQQQAGFELETRNTWYRTGLDQAIGRGQEQVYNNPDALEAAKQEAIREIDASGLPVAEKEAYRLKVDQGLAASLAMRVMQDDPAYLEGNLGVSPGAGFSSVGSRLSQDLMRDFDLTAVQAAAFVGNLGHESGGFETLQEIKPVVAGSRGGYGYAQWTGPRRRQFEAWAKERDLPLDSYAANYGFLRHELANTSEGSVINRLRQATTLESATRLVSDVFLRPGIPGMVSRIKWANKALMLLGDGKAPSVPQQREAALADTRSTRLDPRFAALPFSQRLQLAGQARQQSAAMERQIQAQQKAEYTAYNDRMELDILTGKVTSEDQILMDPVLSDSDISARLRNFRTQKTEANAVDVALQDYIAGNYGNLNPLDADQRKTANAVYDRLNEATQAQPDAVRQATTNSFIKQTGIIPDPVQADLRRGLYSNSPQDYASSLDAAGQIEDTAPIAFDSMPNGNDLRTELTSYRYMVNELGMDSTSAAQRLMERKSPDFKRNEQVWGQEADRIAKDLEATDVTKELNDGWIWSRPGDGADPTTQASLLAEYREAFKDRFIRVGGDEGEAKKLAMEDLKRTWGISEVSGDRQLMKFPPEKFYPAVDGGHAYLRDDAMTTALDVAGIDAAMIGNIMLRPSPATSADIRAGRPPRYRLFYTREENGQTVVDEAPGYWAMDEAAVRGMRDQAWEDVEGERQRWEGLIDTGTEGIASSLMGETVPQPSPETAPPPLPAQGEFVDPASMMRGVDVFPNQGPQIGETAGDIGERLQQQGRSMREQNANR